MITLPSRTHSESPATSDSEHAKEGPSDQEPKGPLATGETTGGDDMPLELSEPRPSLTSIYDAIDHNLINFDM